MTREDLKNYKYNQEWIKDRQLYIEEYRASIEKITGTLSDMPKASKSVEDGMAEKIATLIDIVNELTTKIVQVAKKQQEILNQVDLVEQPYRTILDKVYIQGKSLVKVASEMDYSYRDLCRKHGIALNKFDENKSCPILSLNGTYKVC